MSDQTVRHAFGTPRKVTESPDAYFFVNPSGEDLMLPKSQATPERNAEGLAVAVSMTEWIHNKRRSEGRLEGQDASGNATDTTRFQEQDKSEMSRQDWYELFLTAAFLVCDFKTAEQARDAAWRASADAKHVAKKLLGREESYW